MDSAIRAVCTTESLVRVTVQRTRMHDPRYSANSWSDGHPAGPQGITFSYCGGNHVFRHNEIYSTTGKRFNDGMGGEDNFSKTGFPNADSDIYGNKITHTWDDGIEAEGANENVRIWGNYLDRTATGIATTVTSVGPVYIFRNVFNRNNFYERVSPDQDDRQPFFKSGSDASLGDGRRYLIHNTMLQATQSGSSYGLGGGAGVGGTGSTQPINNTVSMNNIYHLWKPNGAMYQVGRTVSAERTVTVLPLGAANGILSHATTASCASARTSAPPRRVCREISKSNRIMSPVCVGRSVERVAIRTALHVEDTGLAGQVAGLEFGHGRLPRIRAGGERIHGHRPQVLLRNE